MSITYVNFSKVFDSVSNSILVSEFRCYGLHEKTTRWVKIGWRIGQRRVITGLYFTQAQGLAGSPEKALGSPGRQHTACASGVRPGSKGS